MKIKFRPRAQHTIYREYLLKAVEQKLTVQTQSDNFKH